MSCTQHPPHFSAEKINFPDLCFSNVEAEKNVKYFYYVWKVYTQGRKTDIFLGNASTIPYIKLLGSVANSYQPHPPT